MWIEHPREYVEVLCVIREFGLGREAWLAVLPGIEYTKTGDRPGSLPDGIVVTSMPQTGAVFEAMKVDSGRVALKADGEVKVMLPKSGAERLVARIVYTGPVPAPVTEGTPIGNLKVWRNDSLILTMPLKAAENIGKGNMPQRAFDAVTEMIIALFRAGAERL